jgi:hypothetical protein
MIFGSYWDYAGKFAENPGEPEVPAEKKVPSLLGWL